MYGKFLISLSAGMLMLVQTAWADKFPETTVEGLPRVESKRMDAVYWNPEADLAEYDKVMIRDCSVAFRKNWQRDQNRSRSGSRRITAEDMDGIRVTLCKSFSEVFTRELQEKGGYEVVDTAAEGVLLLHPAIVNLDINAPDTMSPGRSTTYTTSAGQMTLMMVVYDSSTGTLLGKAVDRKRASDRGFTLQTTNRVTNLNEANRILRKWATVLRDALDEARGK